MIGSLDSEEGPNLSENENDPLGHFISSKFDYELNGFEPDSLFDRNLLKGVLFEEGLGPDIQQQTHHQS